MNKKEKGALWERKSCEFLEAQNCKVLNINYRSRIGEIDIIAEDMDTTLIFIEVKYRNNKKYGYAEEAVSYSKKRKIYLTAVKYISDKKISDRKIRFDVLAIEQNNINWIKDSFWGDEIGF